MKLRGFGLIFFTVSSFIAVAQEKVSLEEVISKALTSNYDVRLAKNASEAAATNDKLSTGALLPQLNLVGSIAWNASDQTINLRDTAENVIERSGQVASTNVAAAAQLNWTLFDGTRMFATRQRLDEIAAQGELLVKNQVTNTIAMIITSYYDVVRQKQQLIAIQEQMAVNEERIKLAERKLQVGTGVKPELLQAQVDMNAQRALLLQQETVIFQLKEQLNALVDMQLPVNYDVADTIIIDLGIAQNENFENIEQKNFQLLSARKNIGIASLSVREQRAGYLPVLNFNAAYNFTRNENTRLINPFSPFYSQNAGLNYGLTLTIPVLNGFNNRRLTQLATIDYNRQLLSYEQQRNAVSVDVRNAFVNYENAKKILLLEEETIGAAKENVSIALQTFKGGVTTSIELRIAQQTLAEAYNRLITARYNAKLAETELLRLNGSLLK